MDAGIQWSMTLADTRLTVSVNAAGVILCILIAFSFIGISNQLEQELSILWGFLVGVLLDLLIAFLQLNCIPTNCIPALIAIEIYDGQT